MTRPSVSMQGNGPSGRSGHAMAPRRHTGPWYSASLSIGCHDTEKYDVNVK